MKDQMTPYKWQESLKMVNCMHRDYFLTCFGKEDGEYLWRKFIGEFDRDVFKFICYLDDSNTRILFNYLMERMSK